MRCLAVKFDCCDNLLPSVHTIFVITMQFVKLNIKQKYYIITLYIYIHVHMLYMYIGLVDLLSYETHKTTN